MQPFQCDLPPQLQETNIKLRKQEQPLVAKHIGGTIRDRNDRSRNRRTDKVPFIAGCSHFTRKNTRFRAPASSPTQSPCNIMQPFQCDLSPELQETHRTTHTGTTTRCKTHRRKQFATETTAAATAAQMRYLSSPAAATLRGKTQGFVLRLPPQHKAHATSCSHSNAICHHSSKKRIETTHTGTTTHCKTHRRNNSRQKRPQPQPPHRRGTFRRRLQPLYTEKHKVRAPASSPKHSPCNIHAAIPMRSATTASRTA